MRLGIGGNASEAKPGAEQEKKPESLPPTVEGTPAERNEGTGSPAAAGEALSSQPESSEAPGLERQSLPPAQEPESSVETSLRRSTRKRGALNGSGAPPQKDETATSSKAPKTPSAKALRSNGGNGGADLPELATPLRRSARRAGSVEPDAKKAAATPGRRSGRNGGSAEPSSEPPVPKPARRGGSRQASAEPEQTPQPTIDVPAQMVGEETGGKSVTGEGGENERGEGEKGRNLRGAISELLEAPIATLGPADPPGGVLSVLGMSSQETFVTATQESVAPGGESQSQALPPQEEGEGRLGASQDTRPPVQEAAPQEEETEPLALEPQPAEPETVPQAQETSPPEQEQAPPEQETDPAEEPDPAVQDTTPQAQETSPPEQEPPPPEQGRQATEPEKEALGDAQNAPEQAVGESGEGTGKEEEKKEMEVAEGGGAETLEGGAEVKEKGTVDVSEAEGPERPSAAVKGRTEMEEMVQEALENYSAGLAAWRSDLARMADLVLSRGLEVAPEMEVLPGGLGNEPEGSKEGADMETEMGGGGEAPEEADAKAPEPGAGEPATKRLKGSPEAGDLTPPEGEKLLPPPNSRRPARNWGGACGHRNQGACRH